MSEIRTISFKSVGVREDLTSENQDQSNNPPIAIKMPMSDGIGADGLWEMVKDVKGTIRQNLKNLLLTNWGERFGLYNYGANLSSLTLEYYGDRFEEEVAVRIKSATSNWMPFVALEDLQIFPVTKTTGEVSKVDIRVFYSVPNANISRDGVELSFFIANNQGQRSSNNLPQINI